MNTGALTKSLPLRALTGPAFEAYGWVAGGDEAAAAGTRPINGGSSLRLDGVGELTLTAEGGMPCMALFRARAQALEGPWQQLERHRLGSQTFVPMGDVDYAVLVALGEAAPDPATLAAFLVSGRQAVTLRPGTWHHGLIALQAGDFIVIERQAVPVDCDLALLPAPVRLHRPV